MRVCLVGATHPCHNPRLVREADSLAAAGHEVRVVAPSFVAELRDRDHRLLAGRKWSHQAVDFCPGGFAASYRAWSARVTRRIYEQLFSMSNSARFVDRAYTPALGAMAAIAASERADWFIAHAHRALPVAAVAAAHSNTRLGFDCEDLLSASSGEPREIVTLIEKKYFHKCHYISVPSETIGMELVRSHGISRPIVLYNVFPLSMVNGTLPPWSREQNSKIKVHWFGQVIGKGRGIEEAIEALSMLRDSVQLDLRGQWASGYQRVVEDLAREKGVDLTVSPPIDHDELIGTLGRFDIGLALERGEDVAYSKTVTNKIGSYLLAGLAVAATDTPGQREILGRSPSVGFLYPSGDATLLAQGLRHWIENREALRDAQRRAWDVARSRFCWDIEKEKFFAVLQN